MRLWGKLSKELFVLLLRSRLEERSEIGLLSFTAEESAESGKDSDFGTTGAVVAVDGVRSMPC